MRFHYDFCNAEPIIRDVNVYDATGLVEGELLMLGNTSKDGGADDDGTAFQTAYEGGATDAVDALGICLETISCTVAPGSATEAGSYAKCQINPFAVYLAEYSQAAADDVAITTAWTGTTLTIGSLEDNWDFGWVLAGDASTTANFKGQLRFVTACAAGSCTLAAPSVSSTVTVDTIVKIRPVNSRVTNLNAGATGLISAAAVPNGVSLHVMENYISSPSVLLTPLRRYTHDGLDLGANVKAFADVAMIDHVYNPA